MMAGMDDKDDLEDQITLESMSGLAKILAKLDENNVRQILINICLRIRPCFEKVGENYISCDLCSCRALFVLHEMELDNKLCFYQLSVYKFQLRFSLIIDNYNSVFFFSSIFPRFTFQDKDAVRAAAFTLFGKLSRFGGGPSKAPFLEQVHTNLITVLLHLNEEEEVVKV